MNPLNSDYRAQPTDIRFSRTLLRNLLPLTFTIAVLALLAVFAPENASAAPAAGPSFTDVQMSQIGTYTAQVAATLDPGDEDVYYWAEYDLVNPPAGEGTTGFTTDSQKLAAGSGPTPIGLTLGNVQPGTSYTVTLVALNADGGGDKTESTPISFTSVGFGSNGVVISNPTSFAVGTDNAEFSGTGYTVVGVGNSTCSIEYVSSADYEAGAADPYVNGSSMPCVPSNLSEGMDGQMVGGWAFGLSPGTSYYWRFLVTNAKGTWTSDDQAFTTVPLAPTASAPIPSNVEPTSATLTSAIDTGHGDTSCEAQIISAADADAHLGNPFSGASSAPCDPTLIPASDLGANASATFTGLAPNTAYRVRFVVTNSATTSTGVDTRFTTAVIPPSVKDPSVVSIADDAAVVAASVNPNDAKTSVYVHFWTQDKSDATATTYLDATAADQTLQFKLASLSPDTDYSYEVVAMSQGGTTKSSTMRLHTDPAPPSASPIPHAPSITSGPARQTFDPVAAFFFVGDSNGFICSIDDGAWAPCSSGDDFGPAGPGDHTFAVRALGVGGLQSDPATYSWTVIDPKSCVVTSARARLYLNPKASKVRLVLRYKSSRKSLVSVDFASGTGKGRHRIGRATAKFKTRGIYRLPRRVSRSAMEHLLSAKRFNVQLDVHGETPSICDRYFSRDLTVKKKVAGQIVVFQKGSAFGPGPLVTSAKL